MIEAIDIHYGVATVQATDTRRTSSDCSRVVTGSARIATPTRHTSGIADRAAASATPRRDPPTAEHRGRFASSDKPVRRLKLTSASHLDLVMRWSR